MDYTHTSRRYFNSYQFQLSHTTLSFISIQVQISLNIDTKVFPTKLFNVWRNLKKSIMIGSELAVWNRRLVHLLYRCTHKLFPSFYQTLKSAFFYFYLLHLLGCHFLFVSKHALFNEPSSAFMRTYYVNDPKMNSFRKILI